ncbi:pyridoxamine 5'-phosphate oxidase family protein [Mollicutes bacterium LVI A0039]|nr:pyridoxamine 5'-phosphate oxidase family protein [Mollicutes bacterium LVI A0039]
MKMMSREVDTNMLNKQIDEFISGFKTCIVGSLDVEGMPYLSALPVVKLNDKFYGYISETAPHYTHMSANRNIQIMFAEDEAKMTNSFLRKRLYINCKVTFIKDDELILREFERIHGELFISTIRKMDFYLIELTIKDGKAIFGAGKAYYLDSNLEYISQDTGKNKHLKHIK